MSRFTICFCLDCVGFKKVRIGSEKLINADGQVNWKAEGQCTRCGKIWKLEDLF